MAIMAAPLTFVAPLDQKTKYAVRVSITATSGPKPRLPFDGFLSMNFLGEPCRVVNRCFLEDKGHPGVNPK